MALDDSRRIRSCGLAVLVTRRNWEEHKHLCFHTIPVCQISYSGALVASRRRRLSRTCQHAGPIGGHVECTSGARICGLDGARQRGGASAQAKDIGFCTSSMQAGAWPQLRITHRGDAILWRTEAQGRAKHGRAGRRHGHAHGGDKWPRTGATRALRGRRARAWWPRTATNAHGGS